MNTVKGQRVNNRRFPGVAGKRPDKAAKRKEEALKRQAAYAALPAEEKAKRNPKKATKLAPPKQDKKS